MKHTINSIANRLTAIESRMTAQWRSGKPLTHQMHCVLDRINWDIQDLSCELIEAGKEAQNDRLGDTCEDKHGDLMAMTWDEDQTITDLRNEDISNRLFSGRG